MSTRRHVDTISRGYVSRCQASPIEDRGLGTDGGNASAQGEESCEDACVGVFSIVSSQDPSTSLPFS